MLLQVVAPLIDPDTKQRIHFVNSGKDAAKMMPPLLDMTKMERCLSGTSDYEFWCALQPAATESCS